MAKNRSLVILIGVLAALIGIWMVSTLIGLRPEEKNPDVQYNVRPTNKELEFQPQKVGPAISEDLLVDLTPEEFKKVVIVSWASRRQFHEANRLVQDFYEFTFSNGNPFEVAVITMTVTTETPGLPSYVSEAKITGFDNETCPISNTLLGLELAHTSEFVANQFPMDQWYQGTSSTFKITRIQKLKSPPSPDTIRGMRHALLNAETEDDQLDFLKAHPETIKLVEEKSKVSGTLIAFSCCPPKVVDYVMRNGGDRSSVDRLGAGIMHYSARAYFPGGIESAKKYGGDPNAVASYSGNTPLHYSALSGRSDLVRQLVDLGANVNFLNKRGDSPLSFAVVCHNPLTVKALIRNGADIEIRARNGDSLMHRAFLNRKMMETLLEEGLSVDAPNSVNGQTPLLYAASQQDNYSLEWLIHHGADLKAVDKEGKDIFETAKGANTLKTDKFIKEILRRIEAGEVIYPDE